MVNNGRGIDNFKDLLGMIGHLRLKTCRSLMISLNNGFEGDLEGIPVYEEYPSEYKDIDDDDVLSKLDELPHEEFEDYSVFKISGEFELVLKQLRPTSINMMQR